MRGKTFKIGDFGLSMRLDKKGQFYGRGGTQTYNALEKYTSPKKRSHESDIYALGVIFYQILYGIHPYYNTVEF